MTRLTIHPGVRIGAALWLGLTASLLLALAGCDRGEPEGAEGEASAASGPRLSPLALLPATPGLPQGARALRFGQDEAAAKASGAAVVAQGERAAEPHITYTLPLEGYVGGARLIAHFSGSTPGLDRVELRAAIPVTDSLAILRERWGAPDEMVRREGGSAAYWFDDRAGLRVTARPTDAGDLRLDFEPWRSAQAFIGEAEDAFGFEPEPLLGLKEVDLRHAFGARLRSEGGQLSVTLPFLGVSERPPRLALTLDEEGHVTRWTVVLSTEGHLTLKGDLVRALTTRFDSRGITRERPRPDLERIRTRERGRLVEVLIRSADLTLSASLP